MHDVQGGSSCLNKCTRDIHTFECKCPATRIWEAEKLTCSLQCKFGAGDCTKYLPGNHCVAVTDVNKGTDCITECNGGEMNFTCVCPANNLWNADKHKCDLICPYPAVDFCNATEKSMVDIPCITTRNLEGGSECKTICLNNSLVDFQCHCPQTPVKKQWSSSNHYCDLECVKGSGNCVDYPDKKFCIAITNVNGGFNCNTTCLAPQRNYICECPKYYTWNANTNYCDLKCPPPPSEACSATTIPLDTACVPSNTTEELGGGHNCKSVCFKDKKEKSTDCDNTATEINVWSFSKHKCTLQCSNQSIACNAIYKVSLDCIAVPDGGGIDCTTLCPSSKRDFTCNCPTGHSWLTNDKYCLKNCPDGSNACQPATYAGGWPCYLAVYPPNNEADNCTAACNYFTNKDDYSCNCKPGAAGEVMVWSFKSDPKCIMQCLKDDNAASCGAYPDSKDCIFGSVADLSSTNGGINCKTICNTTRSYVCSCDTNPRKWFPEILACRIDCPEYECKILR